MLWGAGGRGCGISSALLSLADCLAFFLLLLFQLECYVQKKGLTDKKKKYPKRKLGKVVTPSHCQEMLTFKAFPQLRNKVLKFHVLKS